MKMLKRIGLAIAAIATAALLHYGLQASGTAQATANQSASELVAAAPVVYSSDSSPVAVPLASRNLLRRCRDAIADRQPFSRDSFWNHPIGTGAKYVNMYVNRDRKTQKFTPFIERIAIDQAQIFDQPDAPLMPVYLTENRWGKNVKGISDRCKISPNVTEPVDYYPIPKGYVTRFISQTQPNNPVSILLPDGKTLMETQPFQVCPGGDYATTSTPYVRRSAGKTVGVQRQKHVYKQRSLITGEGRLGLQGGSGLSSRGGTIRLGELRNDGRWDTMRHALKLSLPSEYFLYCDRASQKSPDTCYRWPAIKSDTNSHRYGSKANHLVKSATQGSLWAIPASTNIKRLGLQTWAGRKIAWTFQNYGAYQAEGVEGWGKPTVSLVVEQGPKSDNLSQAYSVSDEFQADYGETMTTQNSQSPWFQDMSIILSQLHLVENNRQTAPGGGGRPLQPLAPALCSLS